MDIAAAQLLRCIVDQALRGRRVAHIALYKNASGARLFN